MKYTVCDGCPCLNNDYEQGSSCNLDYATDLVWVKKDTRDIVEDNEEMRSHQKDFDLINASFNCGLDHIKHSGGVFVPGRVC